MSKPWYGRIVYSGEGIEIEHKFTTEAEARAYAVGFADAQEISTNGDSDALDDYFSCASDEESIDEDDVRVPTEQLNEARETRVEGVGKGS